MKKTSTLLAFLLASTLSFGQLIYNEVLYDPSNNELDGDANGDGVYAQNEDEFLEIVNTSDAESLDISGWKVFDDEALEADEPRHVFPEGTVIIPGGCLVLFGGGTPTGDFGGAIVQTSTTGDMNLNNSGDNATITDAEGNTIIVFEIEPLSNNPNESYTRNPDLTGEFEQHNDNFDVLFSPGTKVDGTPFETSVGVAEIGQEIFEVYPNPVVEQLTIRSENLVDEIHLYDATGKLVGTFGSNTRTIDMSAYQEGLYILDIRSADYNSVMRIVKSE